MLWLAVWIDVCALLKVPTCTLYIIRNNKQHFTWRALVSSVLSIHLVSFGLSSFSEVYTRLIELNICKLVQSARRTCTQNRCCICSRAPVLIRKPEFTKKFQKHVSKTSSDLMFTYLLHHSFTCNGRRLKILKNKLKGQPVFLSWRLTPLTFRIN